MRKNLLSGFRAETALRNAIVITGIICASLSAKAQAQTATTPDVATGEEGDIVVTGSRPIAESEAAALEVQKNSDSLVAVIAADSVGRLPDQNIAQATGRLPGVAIERDQGQARYISLRGAPNYWTTLSFDGINTLCDCIKNNRIKSGNAGHAG
jgi:outer membrane receptor for ferrienterochelin and colicin